MICYITQLETQVRYMKSELESLFRDRKVLRQRLESAIKEHKMMELILADTEAEHDKAVAKIELLRHEVKIYCVLCTIRNFYLSHLSISIFFEL